MQLTRRTAAPIAVAVLAVAALAGCSTSAANPSSTPAPATTPTTLAVKQPTPPTCPLTGLPPRKPRDLARPALAVKIDNVSDALPQAGINSADVVVEELVEGGLTRLMAIFQCGTAPVVGPVRSLRISDADILALLHGSILGYSGANPKDMPPVVAHSDAVLISQGSDPQYFYRSDIHAAPHNLFTATKRLTHAGLAKRKSLKAPKPLFSYGPIDQHAKTTHHISLTWPAASAEWTWSSHGWLRTQNGAPDKVAAGRQISATNVVVLSVDIASTGLHDVLGTPSPRDVTVGHNKAWVLRNGKMVRGTWTRKSITAPIVLRDYHGHTISLAPGRTWIELLPKPGKPAKG